MNPRQKSIESILQDAQGLKKMAKAMAKPVRQQIDYAKLAKLLQEPIIERFARGAYKKKVVKSPMTIKLAVALCGSVSQVEQLLLMQNCKSEYWQGIIDAIHTMNRIERGTYK